MPGCGARAPVHVATARGVNVVGDAGGSHLSTPERMAPSRSAPSECWLRSSSRPKTTTDEVGSQHSDGERDPVGPSRFEHEEGLCPGATPTPSPPPGRTLIQYGPPQGSHQALAAPAASRSRSSCSFATRARIAIGAARCRRMVASSPCGSKASRNSSVAVTVAFGEGS